MSRAAQAEADIIALPAEIDIANVSHVEAELIAAITAGSPIVVADLTAIRFIDYTAGIVRPDCLLRPRVERGGQPPCDCIDQSRRGPVAQGIIDALRHDHDEVRKLFARLDAATGKKRQDLFQRLVGELVRHEIAEEEILRPVSKRDAGAAIANARIKEESQAEELLKEMEKLDPGSAEFTAKLAKLRREVERHAEAEETKEFPRVAKKETAERLEQMGRAYEAAKKAAPTRPHPSTPNTPGANMLAGPFAAVVDRARDAVRDAVKSTS